MDLKGAGTDPDGYRTGFREIRGLPAIPGMTSMNFRTKLFSTWVLPAIFSLVQNWSQTTKLSVVISILILYVWGLCLICSALFGAVLQSVSLLKKAPHSGAL
jgi:hypothetical protein